QCLRIIGSERKRFFHPLDQLLLFAEFVMQYPDSEMKPGIGLKIVFDIGQRLKGFAVLLLTLINTCKVKIEIEPGRIRSYRFTQQCDTLLRFPQIEVKIGYMPEGIGIVKGRGGDLSK